MVISGIFTNVIGGWLMNRVPGQPLMLVGLIGNLVRDATLNINAFHSC